jgi:hypothetical protein
VKEYLATLDDTAWGAASEVVPKFVSPSARRDLCDEQRDDFLSLPHETGHSKTVLPCSSTTRTRLDPQKSPPFLNSSARTLA